VALSEDLLVSQKGKVRRQMSKDNNINALEYEIQAEKAASYFRIIKNMEAALKALAEFDRQDEKSLPANAGVSRVPLMEDAAEQVWFFVIQREALGLPWHENLFEEYGIPDEVRRRMGPKRKSVNGA